MLKNRSKILKNAVHFGCREIPFWDIKENRQYMLIVSNTLIGHVGFKIENSNQLPDTFGGI